MRNITRAASFLMLMTVLFSEPHPKKKGREGGEEKLRSDGTGNNDLRVIQGRNAHSEEVDDSDDATESSCHQTDVCSRRETAKICTIEEEKNSMTEPHCDNKAKLAA